MGWPSKALGATVRAFAAAMITAAGGAAVSADPTGNVSERSPDGQSSRQSAGNLSAQLILVADDRQAFKAWDTPQETIVVGTVRSVVVGGQANAFVVFRGCAPAQSGHCDVTMRLHVYRPDGKVYAVTPPLEVWQYKPAPPAHVLQLSAQYLKVVVEPQDQLGTYIVSASVKDHVSGASLQLSTAFEATR